LYDRAAMASPARSALSDAEIEARLAEIIWYHTIDVRPGLATNGVWDLRHALPLIPFPEVAGKRCLDVGTWDGFYGYELERRGAAEVVCIDVPDLGELDYPPEVLADPTYDPSHRGKQPRPAGFHLLREILGSAVEWQGGNVYDLDPAEHGTFDVVVMGSLIVHLRDPVRALDAVRSVVKPGGRFLSIDFLHAPVHLLGRRRPLFELRGVGGDFQWWLPSDAGLRHMLHISGFNVDISSRPFLLRPGPLLEGAGPGQQRALRRLTHWALTGDRTRGGHLHRAYLTTRRF
jgi:tRNA (mo5U34)-methyltransferase